MKDEVIEYSKIAGISIGKGLLVGIIGLLVCLLVIGGLAPQIYEVLSDADLGASGHSPAVIWIVPILLFKADPIMTIDAFLVLFSIVWIILFAYRIIIKTAISKAWEKQGVLKAMFENRIRRTALKVLASPYRWEKEVVWSKLRIKMLQANAKDPDRSWLKRKVSRYILRKIGMENVNMDFTKEEYANRLVDRANIFIAEQVTIVYWPYYLNLLVLIILLLISFFI